MSRIISFVFIDWFTGIGANCWKIGIAGGGGGGGGGGDNGGSFVHVMCIGRDGTSGKEGAGGGDEKVEIDGDSSKFW